jgi:hypothetical protein
MLIKCIDNQIVEMKIIGYEFPDLKYADDNNDRNWLKIYLNVKANIGNWSNIDSALMTVEVEQLIRWFSELSDNKEPESNLNYFLEPNISFDLLNKFNDNIKLIRITFDQEFLPKNSNDDDDYFVDFEADNVELKRLAEDLKTELEKYPYR